ncbi:MAG: hypothetical protein WCJ33_01420 [Pseudomonadota bacterium]
MPRGKFVYNSDNERIKQEADNKASIAKFTLIKSDKSEIENINHEIINQDKSSFKFTFVLVTLIIIVNLALAVSLNNHSNNSKQEPKKLQNNIELNKIELPKKEAQIVPAILPKTQEKPIAKPEPDLISILNKE